MNGWDSFIELICKVLVVVAITIAFAKKKLTNGPVDLSRFIDYDRFQLHPSNSVLGIESTQFTNIIHRLTSNGNVIAHFELADAKSS